MCFWYKKNLINALRMLIKKVKVQLFIETEQISFTKLKTLTSKVFSKMYKRF